MKEFRKTKDGLFICEECNLKFINLRALALHLYFSHNGKKEYFNKWIKDEHDKCVICKKPTKFNGLYGYKKTCSKECEKKLRKQTNKKIYGKEYPTQNIKIKEKIKKTCLKKYNKKSFLLTDKCKNAALKKYNVESNVFQSDYVKRKSAQTHLKNLGVENPSKSDIIKEKKKETCLKNYGVEAGFLLGKTQQTNNKKYGVDYPMQNKEIFEKAQKTRCYLKKFRNTNINYRGSYELDFLNKYYDKFPDIENGKAIKYYYENKNKIYFPDFYIPSLNLIIECKNSYLYKRYKDNIEAKEKTTIANGYKYILILDKDYSNLFL